MFKSIKKYINATEHEAIHLQTEADECLKPKKKLNLTLKCYSQKDLNSFKSIDRPERADKSDKPPSEEDPIKKQLKKIVNPKPERKSISTNKATPVHHLIIKPKDESAPILKGLHQVERRPIIRKFKSQNIKNDIIKNNLSSDQVSYRKVMDRSLCDEPAPIGDVIPV